MDLQDYSFDKIEPLTQCGAEGLQFKPDERLCVPEILAPAGGREQFFAALNAGADAVFLGLNQFNARARAENFSLDDLHSLVPLAHRYGMKVLVTLNILIKDVELNDLVETLAGLERLCVDAIIVQDLGVAKIVRDYFPAIRLHASTQMAVHNLSGVQEALRFGFKRVVLARELTSEEIRRIRRAVSKEEVELEVFCHGSLCYSYSGLCFFSGASDARSGNRGECAYTCREPYKVVSEPGHGFLFSMRDLDTANQLDQMIAAGVDTLKIEGRKKDAQYVASVVRLYRKKLDQLFGRSTLRDSAPPLARDVLPSEVEIRKDLQLSFQRKTTSFFIEGRYHENVIDLNNPTHYGVKVGTVKSVASNWVGVLLEDDVERYDGLKIVASEQLYHAKPQHGEAVQGDDSRLRLRYDNREVSFSLRAMMLRGRSIVAASRGMIVDIEIPDGAVAPQVGDAVFKARSDSLRRRIEKLIGPPVDARLRPMTPVKALIAVVSKPGDGHLLDVKLTFQGEIIAAHEYDLGVCEERNKGDLESDLSDVFHIFGDEGVYVNEFTYRLERNYFIPKRFLKEVKRALEPNLNFAIQAVCNRHRTEALENLAASVKGLSPVSCSRYTFKIDRIEYLDWIADLALQNGDVRELIFEPKRMFLPGVRPEMFIEPLKRFVDQTSMTVRLALPTVVRAWDEPVLKVWFKAAFDAGFTCYEVGNLGATGLLRHWELPLTNVTSDFTLYSLNGLAAQFWVEQEMKALTLSIEDDAENLASLLKRWPEGAEPIAILYKDTPLFVAEACSLTALHNGCPSSAVCGYRTLEIENKKGERFFVGHEGCKSIVFGQAAYSIAHAKAELMAMGVANFRIDFLTRSYDDSALKAIAMACFEGRPIDGTHSANFYGRLK